MVGPNNGMHVLQQKGRHTEVALACRHGAFLTVHVDFQLTCRVKTSCCESLPRPGGMPSVNIYFLAADKV